MKREKQILIKVTEKEKQMAEKLQDSGLNISQFVRKCIEKKYNELSEDI